jgi:hypothetical protein
MGDHVGTCAPTIEAQAEWQLLQIGKLFQEREEEDSLDSGAKRNVLKRSGFERPFQARQSRLGMAS